MDLTVPTKLVNMVISNYSHALVLLGRGGLGKTRLVTKELAKAGLINGKKYVLLKGYSTPLSLYNNLYINRDKEIIVLDDIEGVFKNKVSTSLLKGALDNGNGKRFVQYHSTTTALGETPKEFELKAKLIIITNRLPTDADFKALLDRCFFYEFKATNQEIIDLMRSIITKVDTKVSMTDRARILNWFGTNIKPYTTNFSMRTLFRALNSFLYDKDGWTTLVLNTLSENEGYRIVYELDSKYDKLGEMREEWCSRTGASFKTLRRYRSVLGLRKYKRVMIK